MSGKNKPFFFPLNKIYFICKQLIEYMEHVVSIPTLFSWGPAHIARTWGMTENMSSLETVTFSNRRIP